MTMIQAGWVKELRDRTGAGMMECKKALVQTKGDIEQAMDYLRKKGLTVAMNKSGRATTEGLVHAYATQDQKVGVLVEVNCETDFVAKNATFEQFVMEIAELVARENPAAPEGLLSLLRDSGESVGDAVNSLIQLFGENISIRRFVRFESELPTITTYIHSDALTKGKVGVLLKTSNLVNIPSHVVLELNKTLMLQIVAAFPRYVHPEDIPAEILKREATFYQEQGIQTAVPTEKLREYIHGRLAKFQKEVCLLQQPFVKNSNQTVLQWIEGHLSQCGHSSLPHIRFARFEKGEDLRTTT